MKKLLLLALLPALLSASWAPLLPKGRIGVTGTFSSFDTQHFYNKEGDKLKSYNDFERDQGEILLEGGLTHRDNLWAYGVYDYVLDHLNGNSYEFGDSELGWKHGWMEWDDAIFSTEIIAIVPFHQSYQPEIRYGKWGCEAALLYAQTYFPFGYKATLDGRLGYRYYSGFPSDQLRSELSCWVDLSNRWQVLVQSAVEFGLFNGNEPPNHSFFFYNAKYRVWKGRLELNYYISDRWSITGGYMRHFLGQNIAAGGEWLVRMNYCF